MNPRLVIAGSQPPKTVTVNCTRSDPLVGCYLITVGAAFPPKIYRHRGKCRKTKYHNHFTERAPTYQWARGFQSRSVVTTSTEGERKNKYASWSGHRPCHMRQMVAHQSTCTSDTTAHFPKWLFQKHIKLLKLILFSCRERCFFFSRRSSAFTDESRFHLSLFICVLGDPVWR